MAGGGGFGIAMPGAFEGEALVLVHDYQIAIANLAVEVQVVCDMQRVITKVPGLGRVEAGEEGQEGPEGCRRVHSFSNRALATFVGT